MTPYEKGQEAGYADNGTQNPYKRCTENWRQWNEGFNNALVKVDEWEEDVERKTLKQYGEY